MLPPETERVWEFAGRQPSLAGFVLVGGTALTLHLKHRVSEDLDFAFREPRLPRAALRAFERAAEEAGFQLARADDAAALDEFEIAGMDLHDYQQDWLVNGAVKLSFFVPDDPVVKVLAPGVAAGPRVATVAELFKTKCLVSASRSRTRDWLDLFLLMRDHGFTFQDYADAFEEAGIPAHCEIGLGRLCAGTPAAQDEGYQHLLPNAPSLEEMRNFFVKERAQWEVRAARRAYSRPAR